MLGIGTLSTGNSLQLSPESPLSSPSCRTTNYQRSMSFPSRNPKRFTVIHAFAETIPKVNVLNKKPANLYEILRVKETASPVEIKTAYRSLAKRIHPDAATSESDSRDFMEIHKAYTTLSDPTARARYDLSIGAAGIRRFGNRSSSSSSSSGGFVGQTQTRRWETDQCW
ncbi:DnaJ domain [Macleaya cordata]|uniref:DnaJ domain n=1 Tax=Macleaya cordata TaxID=56857 RepID=A0A200RAH7_MACCD|nr:DnaJ domain [Macleaya cordata]